MRISVDVHKEVAKKHPELVLELARAQYRYSIFGMAAGLICFAGGIFLFIYGVAGDVSWSLKLLGFESKLANAAPGAVLFVVGAVIVYLSQYKILISDQPSNEAKASKRRGKAK